MRKVTELSAFVFLLVGTLGLLMNEFVFDWGRSATLVFAAVNVIGLIALGFTYWGLKQVT
jgi:hypothetical protein